jgi:subtilisin family serine protease
MNTRQWHKRLGLLIALILLISFVVPVGAAPLADQSTSKISGDVLQATAGGESTQFIVFMEDQADLSAAYSMTDQDARGWYVYNTLKEHAEQTQAPVIDQLEASGVEYTSFWAANMIVVEGDRALAEALAARPDVKVIESDEPTDWILDEGSLEEVDQADAVDFITPGVNNVQAPPLWSLGYNGQGIVVANQDTGVRWTHAALKSKYRGWDGVNANHNYNWWDAIHVQLTGDGGTSSPATNPCGRNITAPCDDQGHGTHTTGTMIGDGGAGTSNSPNQVGVAPGARWIACRNMDSGNGRPSTYSECFQFFIAPTDLNGQNPNPSLRPHVMNNSWGCPPSELCAANTLKTIVENTIAAGIFVVASAGNDGSACSTVQDPPGIYASAFSVGAINGSSNALASFSSRGPVSVDGSGRMKPDLSAPGQSVRSSTRTSDTSYGGMSGTSMASPHVVGVVALLWSARSNLVRDIPRTEYLLTRSANPAVSVPNNAAGCGGIASIPNNHFGWGRVDVMAAYNLEPSLYQTISFDALANKIYGEADFAVNASASSGLAVTFSAAGNCTVSGNTVHITGAGVCTITAGQPGVDVYDITAGIQIPFYPAEDVSQTFSIARSMLTVAADHQAKLLNAPNPVFTYQMTGFVNNEDASVLATQPACTSPATATSPAGAYPITCSGGAAANYDFTYIDGIFNILYSFAGFFQPVDVTPTLNTANSGQTIPLKWRVTDAYGAPVTNLTSVNVSVSGFACPLGASTDQLEEYSAGNSGLINQGDGNYQFNWKTPKSYSKSCKTVLLDLSEGAGYEHTAQFQFTK